MTPTPAVMPKTTPAAATLAARPDEFAMTRAVSGAPAQVWAAFTTPAQLQQWWGPHIIRNDDVQMDLRVCGAYRIVQEFGGILYPLKGEFRRLDAPHQLVMTMDCSEHPAAWHDGVDAQRGSNANPAGIMVLTVTFDTAAGGNTQLTLRTRFESARIRDTMVPMGMADGWNESLEKLDDFTSGKSARTISVSRLYDFPVAVVFDAFTGADKLAHWWGPNGFTITTQRMDFREGGVWQFTMHGPASDGKPGIDYPNKIVYRQIVPGLLIAHSHGDDTMSDTGEGALFQGHIQFASFGGQTRLTNRVEFATAAQRDYVAREREAVEGGQQTLARLAEYLSLRFPGKPD